jgi:uncharacterized membrane protein YqhA
MLRQILSSSRFLVLIAVIGAFIGATVTLVFGGIASVNLAIGIFANGDYTESGAKLVSVAFIEMIDIFLLGTTLYIMALGLYELFIDPHLPVPSWLHTGSMEQLKEKLMAVIAVLLGVSFLGEATEWNGDSNIFSFGAAIALVIFSLGFLMFAPAFIERHRQDEKKDDH